MLLRPVVVLSRLAALAVLAAAVVPSAEAQSTPPKPATSHPASGSHESEDHHAIPWKALDAYHTVMAASWHPAKDRNDLAPFRARAAELVAAARALTAEPVPAACGGPERAANVTAVLRATEEAARLAAQPGIPDTQLKPALKAAHDRFHTVEEGCAAPGAKH